MIATTPGQEMEGFFKDSPKPVLLSPQVSPVLPPLLTVPDVAGVPD